ncbi:uncharacterized protein CG7065-like isoform X2 [Spodoptera litura]|uniref:Uncharacterized protein CG7065-like isoform X2 n=1 Tax=Spodoptera litura TaxID=69820 RepID=A0A9J7E0D9_SPOLT|nr:uncharacterized protein CG7065-like isoform X2 [Spodoptera litura]
MDLPDCPPGAEGYEDTVTEVPRKPELEDSSCTKAELEFQEHLNSLKINLEDGSTRCMVERRERDISGKWMYLCYPCSAVCSGETILQTHLSGKKHKAKLTMRNVWPLNIFADPPSNNSSSKPNQSEKAMQKLAVESDIHNKYNKYRNITCHLQDSLDAVKAPLLGLEYLIEHPPEQAHYEPSYICTLCSKYGHPRTIINHMTCFWHRHNYLVRHYTKASALLAPYRIQPRYRVGVQLIMNRLAQLIEDKYGRMRPVNIEKEEYEKNKEQIHQWVFQGHHFSEKDGPAFTEVVDIGLLDTLHKSGDEKKSSKPSKSSKEPSPPIVAAPSKPLFNNFSRPPGRQERRAGSVNSLSDISDEADFDARRHASKPGPSSKERHANLGKSRYEPYPDRRNLSPGRRTATRTQEGLPPEKKPRPPNYEYKVKLAEEKRLMMEDSANKTLAYHEKNPEKHPLYPEEWKKFWNRRYKEIQAEGKDPSKHDFKPEWIVFWTARMKELHEEELRVRVNEIYRRMCLSPPDMNKRSPDRLHKKSLSPHRKSSEPRHRSPEPRRRSPEPRRRSPEPRRRSPERHRGDRPERAERRDRQDYDRRGREPLPRRRTPEHRRTRRSPLPVRRSPGRRRSPERRRSPLPYHKRTRSRSPFPRRSPLSQRSPQRNRSPDSRHAHPPPSMQTVLISDDDLKPDDISPWNSDNDIESVASVSELRPGQSRAGSSSRGSRPPPPRRRLSSSASRTAPPATDGDNVVATLRQLVALEDYLGSLGPRIVDLLAEALKMEKEKANSSEALLDSEKAVVLIETAKEKLKGAVQAGLVAPAAAAALRAAIVRAAATLHEADKRAKRKQEAQKPVEPSKPAAVPVAGVGEVDRAQIAQQMAEALIAQGKTDVSSEDLAALVDAVVGMAEAKKRAAEDAKKATALSIMQPTLQSVKTLTPKPSGTASALQLLQSAYDDNEKMMDQSISHAPDAMDGLSDSDLETLLKNFNELSAEEQHSLIAYLKKMETKEPQRVERLRQYVSDAAAVAPKAAVTEPPAPQPEPPAVIVESDDDDYTVEEVFQSATQKVKEDQIRQEMEIVKKSLEETKPESPAVEEPVKLETTLADLTKSLSSASDLFALVQASLKSTPAATPAPLSRSPNVVVSNTQPRSFGDLPECTPAIQESPKSLMETAPVNTPVTSSFNSPQAQGPATGLPFPSQQQGNLSRPPIHQGPPQLQQHRPQQLFHQPLQQNYQSPQQQNYQSPPQQNYQSPQQNQPHYNQQKYQGPQHNQGPLNQQHNLQSVNQQHSDLNPNNQQHNQLAPNQQHNQQFQQHGQPQHQQQYRPQQQYQQQHNFNDNRNKSTEHYNPRQWNPRPNNPMDNRNSATRGPAPDNVGSNAPYNQVHRNNFMNGRGQDNYNTRQQNPITMNQQFGMYDNNQHNFRGRGRGFSAPMRGRGRGYY